MTPTEKLADESKLFEFLRWAMTTGPWIGSDLDGAAVQDKALELGLIVETKYDPDVHGRGECAEYVEPGDIWYVLADAIPVRALPDGIADIVAGSRLRLKGEHCTHRVPTMKEIDEAIVALADGPVRALPSEVTDEMVERAARVISPNCCWDEEINSHLERRKDNARVKARGALEAALSPQDGTVPGAGELQEQLVRGAVAENNVEGLLAIERSLRLQIANLQAENERLRADTDQPTLTAPSETRHPWPRKGDRMRFLGENGYEHQLAIAKKIFEVGKEYEVESCEVGDWHHEIIFAGINGSFNGVMFERVTRVTSGMHMHSEEK